MGRETHNHILLKTHNLGKRSGPLNYFKRDASYMFPNQYFEESAETKYQFDSFNFIKKNVSFKKNISKELKE